METLRKIQLLQLMITEEIIRICRNNEIPYFITGGTLLGAVRHKGFIPWDDDMDIGMTRNNYSKFIKAAGEQLGEEYFLQTWDVEEEYGTCFAKIRLNDTEYIERNSKLANFHKGIYVDVFPFDNVPDNRVLRIEQRIMVKYYKLLLLNKCKYYYVNKNKTKEFFVKILRLLSRLYPIGYLRGRFMNVMTRYNSMSTNYVIAFGGASSFERETIKREWIEKLVPLSFEGKEFYGPENYDAYLRHLYGDYMTLPPENERNNKHGIIYVSLGHYFDED